jgi:hypothetical protein
VNPLLTRALSNYAIDKGFASERERLELILTVPSWGQEALEVWMNLDGSKDGLVRLLAAKRPVRRITTEDV